MRETHRAESTLGTPDARRTAPCRPADARRRVRCVVAERCATQQVHCDTEALDDALLVVSELTSNAMLHGGGITDFSVDVVGRDVRVTVSDRSDELPVALGPLDEQGRYRVGGRGWPIVCRLAHDVQVACLPRGGKRITALVPLN